MTFVRRTFVLTLAIAVALGTAAVTVTGSQDAQAGGALRKLLPDLRPSVPFGLVTRYGRADGKRYVHLAFASQTRNVGDGPLIVRGARPDVVREDIVADQIVKRANGTEIVNEGVGTLEFVVDPTHSHWHLLEYMTYELRRASDWKLVAPHQKTGFCLGDRVNANPKKLLPGEPEQRVFTGNCGLANTSLLELEEGISVGWADPYAPWVDGQYLDITGLPAGNYVLVHRVNPTKALLETKYGNNAASLRLRLTWPNGKSGPPKIKVLKRCPKIARCTNRR